MDADREQAKQDYLKGMAYKDLAAKYGVAIGTIKSWKRRYGWERKGMHPKAKKDASINASKRGAPQGSKNARGNRGGSGAPAGNDHAEKHGFFARIFPDDPETKAIVKSIEIKSPLDILWENIVIQYTAIARAQRIMFVKDRDDMTKVLKRVRDKDNMQTSEREREWEIQHAWDKQATFLQAQSRAIKILEGLIARYEELLPGALQHEEQRLRVEKLKAEVASLGDDDKPIEIVISRKGEG